jgi:anthranilate synthase component 2
MNHRRLLLIDNHDSFTYNISDYLKRLGVEVKVLERPYCRKEDIYEADAVVISPGPGNPENLPDLMELISHIAGKKPVLGICLGHQALAHYYGGRIVPAKPMHGKISMVQKVNKSCLLNGIPDNFRVVRYHSLLVTDLPEVLVPLLITEEKQLMAFAHKRLHVAGIQFHPEAHLTDFGLLLLKNWLDCCVVD